MNFLYPTFVIYYKVSPYKTIKLNKKKNNMKEKLPHYQAGIYKITCLATNKMYIGESKCIYKRWWVHKMLLRQGKHHNTYLQNTFKRL